MTETETKIDPAVQAVIDFAVSFTSLSVPSEGKLRIRRSVSDLMHTMGYYTDQVKLPHVNTATRLANIAEALKHIAQHLET